MLLILMNKGRYGGSRVNKRETDYVGSKSQIKT